MPNTAGSPNAFRLLLLLFSAAGAVGCFLPWRTNPLVSAGGGPITMIPLVSFLLVSVMCLRTLRQNVGPGTKLTAAAAAAASGVAISLNWSQIEESSQFTAIGVGVGVVLVSSVLLVATSLWSRPAS